MQATLPPMAHVWPVVGDMQINRLDFDLEVQVGGETQHIVAYIQGPKILDEHPGCWTCIVGWVGHSESQKLAFGATPLQALSISTDVLASSLRLAFGPEVTVDKLPFFFS